MIGEDPVWVTAEETKNDPVKFKEGVDETIQFQLGFPGGAVASCLSTYSMNNLDRFFLDGKKALPNYIRLQVMVLLWAARIKGKSINQCNPSNGTNGCNGRYYFAMAINLLYR